MNNNIIIDLDRFIVVNNIYYIYIYIFINHKSYKYITHKLINGRQIDDIHQEDDKLIYNPFNNRNKNHPSELQHS